MSSRFIRAVAGVGVGMSFPLEAEQYPSVDGRFIVCPSVRARWSLFPRWPL